MIQSFDEWKAAQSNPTPQKSGSVSAGKIPSFDEWKAAQPVVPAKQGFLSKALDFGKSAVQSVAQGIAQPVLKLGGTLNSAYLEGQSVLGTLTGDKQKADDYHAAYKANQNKETDLGYLGKVKPIQNGLDAVGTGLELGSNLVGGEGTGSVVKQGMKGLLTQGLKTGVKVGAASGALMGAGQGLSQENPTVADTVKSTAIGAGTGSIAGGLLGLGGAYLGSKIKPKVAVEPKVTAAMDVVKNVEQPKPVITPEIKQANYAKSQGYEPYTPPEQLPTIQMGQKEKSTLPTIDYNAPTPKAKSDITYEPVSTPPVLSKPNPSVQPVETTSRLTPVEGTGAVKTRGLAKSLSDNLNLTLGDLPEYRTLSNKDQIFNKAADLVANDPEKAIKIALGHEAPPEGIHPEAVYAALSEHAKSDHVLAHKLGIQSSLISEGTTMGQRIQLLSQIAKDSPVNVIKDVQKSLNEVNMKRVPGGNINKAKSEVASQIKSVIQKNAPKVEDWHSFIDSLTC